VSSQDYEKHKSGFTIKTAFRKVGARLPRGTTKISGGVIPYPLYKKEFLN